MHSTAPPENKIEPERSPLRVAVQAAIDAYAVTGRMLDAALAYAAHGYPIFPLDEVDKSPIPRRDPDPSGRFPKGLPCTGGFYKATTDELTIRRWWKHREYLIGMPMGARSGVWALDVDTDAEHDDDGIAAWRVLTTKHGAVVTREHRTASEGLHLLFHYDDEHPIGCSAGSIPNGIEVKGRGGYIVVPPSRRKGKAYYVGADIEPVAAPEWLTELIGTRRAVNTVISGPWKSEHPALPDTRTPAQRTREIEMLVDAMRFVPNNNLTWDDWTKVGLALYAATNGSGEGWLQFHLFSAKSSKNIDAVTEERWQGICSSPPHRIGAGYLFRLARENGWTIEATAPEPEFGEADAARVKIAETIDDFFRVIEPEVWSGFRRFLDQEYGSDFEYTLAWGMRISTGAGKTQIAIRKIAGTNYRVLYVVPILELAGEIEQQFRDLGVSVAVFRGRDADDPDNPGARMCLDPEAVKTALDAHLDVTKTCCRHKQFKCAFFDSCGYQRQKQQEVQVWIAASNVLFHKQEAFGQLDVVVVDESMWTNALVGIKAEEMITMPLAVFDNGRYEERVIVECLKSQSDDGGVQRSSLDNIDDEMLHRLINRMWQEIDQLQEQLNFHPGLSKFGRKHLNKRHLGELTIAFERKQIAEELRTFLKGHRIRPSGRLQLDHHKGQRVIKWRGLKQIYKQYKVPTLLLDATLPDCRILKELLPQIDIVADIDVALPDSVFVRQVLSAPTSDSKLSGKDEGNEKKRKAIRRYILKRWIETGRQAALVICQLEFEEWLRGKLPDEIRLAHFNNIVGLDDHRDVRLMILIGRTQPGPEAPEAHAGALSGVMPEPATHCNPTTGFTWYTPELRRIKLKNGNGMGVPVLGDLHPDPLAEQVRWQICERELVQAFGRARAINRTPETPLDVELLFNTVLPITVNEAASWEEPSLLWEIITQGVVLTSRVDLMKAWPGIGRPTGPPSGLSRRMRFRCCRASPRSLTGWSARR